MAPAAPFLPRITLDYCGLLRIDWEKFGGGDARATKSSFVFWLPLVTITYHWLPYAITLQDPPGPSTTHQDRPYTYRTITRHRVATGLESWNAKRKKPRISITFIW